MFALNASYVWKNLDILSRSIYMSKLIMKKDNIAEHLELYFTAMFCLTYDELYSYNHKTAKK